MSFRRVQEIIVNEFRLVVLIAIFGCALVTALAAAGRVGSVFELAANLRELAFGIGAIAGCGLLMDHCIRQALGFDPGRRSVSRAALAASVACVLINGYFVLPEALAEPDTCQPTMRVVTANTYVANETPEQAHRHLVSLDADVLVVEEMLDHVRVEMVDAYPYFVTDRPHGLHQGHMPVGVFSRYPLIDPTIWQSDLQRPIIDVLVDHPNGRFRLLATHPLPAVSLAAGSDRDEVLAELGRRVRMSSHPVVVAGDLNVTPWSPAWQKVTKGTDLQSVRRGRGNMPSWPTGSPLRIPIDHILTTDRTFTTCEASLSKTPGSDHLALSADLRF